ncbi:hypothetical protein T4B_3308 [Trichinella pseudospiralis]|uniref:Uncharacterized protein n=1 Tax=Trichinella pseudospiralis TaxID=6337 RepID=A0A0V1GN76_TRIPS|nr:hypothetical protein T4B_3308 [Trichinella pseudospiralis]
MLHSIRNKVTHTTTTSSYRRSLILKLEKFCNVAMIQSRVIPGRLILTQSYSATGKESASAVRERCRCRWEASVDACTSQS